MFLNEENTDIVRIPELKTLTVQLTYTNVRPKQSSGRHAGMKIKTVNGF